MNVYKRSALGITGIICFLVFSLWFRGNIAISQDTGVYKDIAENILRSRETGEAIRSEYPPLASTVFFFIHLLPDLSFFDAWIGFMALLAAAGWLCASHAGEKKAYLFPLALCGTVVLLSQETVLARFDIAVATVLFVCWRAHARANDRWAAGALLIAMALKALPLLLMPAILPGPDLKRWKNAVLGSAVVTVVGAGVALNAMGVGGIWSNLEYAGKYQGERGIQSESTWSGVRMLYDMSRGAKSRNEFDHLALHNKELGSGTKALSMTLMVGGALVIGALAWLSNRRRARPSEEWFLASVCWILCASPILSPQFLVWVVPLLLWYVLSRMEGRPDSITLSIGAMTIAAGFLTQWIYPYHYGDLVNDQTAAVVVVLFLRNSSLLVLCGLLLWKAAGDGSLGLRSRNPVSA